MEQIEAAQASARLARASIVSVKHEEHSVKHAISTETMASTSSAGIGGKRSSDSQTGPKSFADHETLDAYRGLMATFVRVDAQAFISGKEWWD